MSAVTSPDNIYYPTGTDGVTPLQTVLANMATSVQNALNAHPYTPADLNALVAISAPTANSIAVVNEGGAMFRYNGTLWVQATPAYFGTTAARDSAYSKASGAFLTSGAEVNVGTSSYIYLGGWKRQGGGLVPIIPTSVTGTGVSVSTSGLISFSAATSITVDGCFNGEFDDYQIISHMTKATATNDATWSLRSAGATNTAANYTRVFNAFVSGSRSDGQILNATSWAAFEGSGANGIYDSIVDIFAPFKSEATRGILGSSGFANAPSYTAQSFHHSAASSFDGFVVNRGGTSTLSGTMRIYGRAL